MRLFQGAVASITINASTGVWTWAWNSSVVSVTSTSLAVTNFLKVPSGSQAGTGSSWTSTGPVDLSGPKVITICCNDLARNAYSSPVPFSPCYLCSIPVGNYQFGDLLSFVPPYEQIVFSGDVGKPITALTFMVMDPRTGTPLPLSASWSMELKVYIDVLQ